MLRRKPTAIALTSEDVAAYEDDRLAERNRQENIPPQQPASNTPGKGDGKIDPNDELKPLPVDRARGVRTGVEASGSPSGHLAGSMQSREERIMGR